MPGCQTAPGHRIKARQTTRSVMETQETTFERHYSVDELASIWGVSDDFIRRLFLREPGVVVFFKAPTR